MLVLSREAHQAICIGDDIRIVVTAIHPHCVKIGIDAPKNMPVHRQEIYDRIARGINDAADR